MQITLGPQYNVGEKPTVILLCSLRCVYDMQAQQADRQHRRLIMLLDFCAEKSRRVISELDGSLGVALASCERPSGDWCGLPLKTTAASLGCAVLVQSPRPPAAGRKPSGWTLSVP